MCVCVRLVVSSLCRVEESLAPIVDAIRKLAVKQQSQFTYTDIFSALGTCCSVCILLYTFPSRSGIYGLYRMLCVSTVWFLCACARIAVCVWCVLGRSECLWGRVQGKEGGDIACRVVLRITHSIGKGGAPGQLYNAKRYK